jgi:FMN-dependent NADH-azoreductase
MWNFSIPYALKHYIDVITQPGFTFSFSPEEGAKGLVTGKPATVIYSRGIDYSPGSAFADMDFQKPYLESWLSFIGFTEIHSLILEPTLQDADGLAKLKTAVTEKAEALAATF